MNIHTDSINKNKFLDLLYSILPIFFLMLILMTILEVLELLFYQDATGWGLHIANVLFASIIAAIGAFFILKKYRSDIKISKDEIDEKKRTYEESVFNHSTLDAILNSTADGILVVDRNGKISWSNKRFAEMWRIPDSLINTKDDEKLLAFILDQLKEPDSFLKKVNEMYLNPEKEDFDIIEFKDGRIWERTSLPQKLGDEIIGRVWNFHDITAQKKIEKVLEKSERKYKDLFEKSQDAILIISGGVFVDCNQAAVNMLCYNDKKEFLGSHPAELSPEKQPDGKASIDKANEMMKLAIEKGSSRFEWEFKKSNGEALPVEVLFTNIDYGWDNIILHTVLKDITQQKQTEETLQQKHILLRTIVDNLPDAIYVKDADCRKTLANRSDLKNMKCEKEEDAIGKTDFDFFPKEIAEVFYADDLKVIKDGQTIINREEYFLDNNGNKNWLLTSKIPFYDQSGNIIGLIGMGHNITDRKRSELVHEALYEISETAHSASDMYTLYSKIHAVVGTLMSSKNFYIALYDEKSGMLSFPYMVDEFDPPYEPKKLGRGLTEFILRNGEAFLIDAKMDFELRDSGEAELVGTPSAIWLGVPLKVRGKTIGVIVVQDYENEKAFGEDEKQLLIFVSEQIAQAIERKRNAEAITKYAEEMRELNKTKDKFFSIVAHDLKSPFAGILGYSQILLEEYYSLSEDEKYTFIKSIDELSQNAFSLLENLLEWSRIQTGRMSFKPVEFNLVQELETTISLITETAKNKKISLDCIIDNQIFIQADKNMLYTIVRNLVSNAIKFTNPLGKVTIRTKKIENFIEISITDTGVGIKKENLDKLFKIETSISTKGTANEEGTGLGLLLCKEMVEKHGGKIWVESEIGKGTTFYFTLPEL